MDQQLFVLAINGIHSKTTRGELVAGMEAKGAKVEIRPGQLANFDFIKVNGESVARGFYSKSDMIQWMAENP